MSKKVLFGLIGSKIVIVDVDTSLKAKKQCFKEKCTSVIVAELTEDLRKKWINEVDVSMSDFTGVEL